MKLIKPIYKQFFYKKLNKLLGKLNKKNKKPSFISISVTHTCCLKCKQCDLWKLPKDKEITTREIKDAIIKLKKWLGPFMLNLSGGEPLMRKDIIEIVKFAYDNDVSTTITTNGFLLDKKTADALVNAGLTNINISLDGFDEIHDFTRGKGTFEVIKKNLDYINKNKKNTNVCIATVVMKQNLVHLPRLIDYINKEKLNGINFQPLIQNIGSDYRKDWHKTSEIWPDNIKNLNKTIDKIIDKKNKGAKVLNSTKQLELMKLYYENPSRHANYKCLVGENNFAVNEYGKVLICFFMNPIGDITKENPGELWNSEKARQLRKRISCCKQNCDLLNCNFY
jgi:MoaA/NifB/PqqE/SkfB family radical SAM enzyme